MSDDRQAPVFTRCKFASVQSEGVLTFLAVIEASACEHRFAKLPTADRSSIQVLVPKKQVSNRRIHLPVSRDSVVPVVLYVEFSGFVRDVAGSMVRQIHVSLVVNNGVAHSQRFKYEPLGELAERYPFDSPHQLR